MIKARFSRTLSGGVRLRISGHAGYSDSGDDIVCAAASGIFYSLCGYLYNFCPENLKIYALQSGLADIECGREGDEAMKMALLGLWQVAIEYPQCVSVENAAFAWKMRSALDVSV